MVHSSFDLNNYVILCALLGSSQLNISTELQQNNETDFP